ncbi:MAG: hypothetical protein GX806_00230 [Lentisphaerae bacterium]|nr:hypothetical protein [Lentisphaerota bacterium]
MKRSIGLLVAGSCLLIGILASGSEARLWEAIRHNNLAQLTALADGNSINMVEHNSGQTALHLAAHNNQRKIAQWLLDNEANVNAQDNQGQTPLYLAAQQGHTDMVALLLLYKADTEASDLHGLTPLHAAAQYGHAELIQRLLTAGADINARTHARSLAPIHWAAFWGHTESLKTLLAYGADINARDSTGDTPLSWAEEYLHYDMARCIARMGGKRHSH